MRSFYHEGQVEVDGEKLTLVCNFHAIDSIESLAGLPMDSILGQLGPGCPYALAGKVLWGLLRDKHEGVTLDEAAGVGFGPQGAAVGLVMDDVLRRAFNLGERAKGENPPKRRGRSKSSEKSG